MQLLEVNPFIRYARMHTCYKPEKTNCVCYDCRIFYILRGDGTLYVGGERYRVGENSVVFLPPASRYRFAFTEPDAVRQYVLNFDLTDKCSAVSRSLGTATEADFRPEKMPRYTLPAEFSAPLIQHNSVPVRSLIGGCVDLFLQREPYFSEMASAILKRTLLELLRGQKNETPGYALARSVTAFIRENFSDVELSNTAIAEQFNYHPYHLSRIMKQFTGQTLHGYLLEYRLHMAKEYLITTALTVTAVAEKTGFSSYSYFIKLFRERTGQSPHRYRQARRNMGL